MKSFGKFIPVIIMGAMVFQGIDILFAAFLALIIAAFFCAFFEKKKLGDIMNAAVEGAKDGMYPAFVLMMAYALAEIYISSGVGASAIELFINLGVTGRSVAAVAFIASCALSLATGTSWGTYAACIPIFMWLSDIVGGNPALVFCACMGGAAFGDNLGLISDTTILACGIVGVKVSDRFRAQIIWSFACVGVSTILFYVTSMMMRLPVTSGNPSTILSSMPKETWDALMEARPSVISLLEQIQQGSPIWLLIPVVAVIVLAVRQVDTIICLGVGIILGSMFGFLSGAYHSVTDVIELIQNGFADAGSWAVIMLFWAMAFGAVMRQMNAYDPLARFFLKISRNVRQLLVCNGLLCILVNATLNEEMSQEAAIGPVIRDIVNENVEGSKEDIYKLQLRNAIFTDSIGVMTAELIPWHTGVAYYLGLAIAVYPLYSFGVKDLYFNFMAIISVLSGFILTFTGWDRFLKMSMPKEPAVRLKKENLELGAQKRPTSD